MLTTLIRRDSWITPVLLYFSQPVGLGLYWRGRGPLSAHDESEDRPTIQFIILFALKAISVFTRMSQRLLFLVYLQEETSVMSLGGLTKTIDVHDCCRAFFFYRASRFATILTMIGSRYPLTYINNWKRCRV